MDLRNAFKAHKNAHHVCFQVGLGQDTASICGTIEYELADPKKRVFHVDATKTTPLQGMHDVASVLFLAYVDSWSVIATGTIIVALHIFARGTPTIMAIGLLWVFAMTAVCYVCMSVALRRAFASVASLNSMVKRHGKEIILHVYNLEDCFAGLCRAEQLHKTLCELRDFGQCCNPEDIQVIITSPSYNMHNLVSGALPQATWSVYPLYFGRDIGFVRGVYRFEKIE